MFVPCLAVRLPMLLAIVPFPVLRSMMSKIISKAEQGEWLQSSLPFVFAQFTKSTEVTSASSGPKVDTRRVLLKFCLLGEKLDPLRTSSVVLFVSQQANLLSCVCVCVFAVFQQDRFLPFCLLWRV